MQHTLLASLQNNWLKTFQNHVINNKKGIMEREKLLEEYKVTLESLVSKTKFIYSEEFYKLDEFEKQKYTKDKMATEGHLSTLCNLLWGEKFQIGNNGLFDLFGLGIIGSMFGGGWGSPSTGTDYQKKALDETENKNGEETYVIPEK